MTNTVHPVILCGGSGTRLWPLSRKSYPKQFVPLVGDATLLQDCADRMLGPSDMPYAKPLVLTNEAFRFIVPEQLAEVGIDPGPILIEPEGRNTAPAVLAAALYLASRNPDAIMLVAPSDHVIPNKSAFHSAVAEGARAIRERGDLVTFGITPTRPETGYGYLKLSHAPDSTERAVPLDRFVEKPDEETAQSMLADGSYLWNSGIFLFAVRDVIAAFEQYAGNLIAPVQKAVNEAKTDLGFLRLDPAAWADAADISIDYAVMEKASNLSVVPYSAGWSDVGSWTAVQELSDMNEDGVATDGDVTAIECRNVLIRSESPTQEVVAMGLENVIAVAMPDAVLVASMDKAQDVKQAVTALKEKGAKQAEALPVDHRPWGWFESLVIGDRFQVKRIHVHPGAALSLQSHHHRSEHWIVVKGTAKVTIDDKEQLVSENQSVYIPLGATHRMENPGKVPMVLIEVQTGAYLGEDDIIRYEDIYARE
ncbi:MULTISPECIES: mannose-1-phosphate guanylyltransferase/mannose-6-phosphate isomerase [unclassified Ruegeria]|uniref:mannose-1-phosphate guanylyltransferase/mannose-6-phosphate isomerase n=1 Tax=unclassified Ruegeria TaxID=2625375 RepID=UPI001489234C|nr:MULTISPECIES: mannose-1-phosphate guanylyltransferase/mannose-6-phosphate isomerase [unclassified Ruegeria]NOD77915.1 mannose-1-phosphate guanylyltransferase/mannose-6-phosphate isomerase [Ruegeria sp. HKCCD4332]NOD88146.1 mannose-1-phosphate guanylyltransferase/mannose-6-phosphate isomerase [Ruegeria sp. HKCCD4318]NOE14994.1 mannose-1-phosphate guanylyltransferase/mannose-6-phosphate isomerase [Ruegeria sp. HKCCD4318-2]NOG11403.1 mannose-1-phosphate guanylyltransferase/mannose-6-phosphate i